jgi:uncharacterized protein with HEPN domain
MDKKPTIFLLHIADAIKHIEEYIDNYSYQQFCDDRKTQDAVIRKLEIIGEATTNLEDKFKKQNPDIPWREISDFRNVLAHEYWDIDLEIVWRTAKEDLVALKNALVPFVQN